MRSSHTSRASGKLLGRATSLWVSLAGAALNFATVFGFLPLSVDPVQAVAQLASINGFVLIVIGFLANEENPTTAGVLEGTTQTPDVTITTHNG